MDKLFSQPVLHRVLFETAILEQESGGRYAAQDGRPGVEDLRRVFSRIVEAAEGAISVLGGRERPDLRRADRWSVANVVVRHAEDFFAVPRFLAVANVEAVGQQSVHRRQAGGSDIAEPRDL